MSTTKQRKANASELEEGSSLQTLMPDESDEKSQKTSRRFFIVPFLVLIWYLTAMFAITSSKLVMNIKSLPFLLCTTQFLSATLFTHFISVFFPNISSSTSSSTSSSNLSTLSEQKSKYSSDQYKIIFKTLVIPIGISYTLGFIFTNIAFSLAPPSFAETIKSSEPISSVLLGLLFFKESSSTLSYFSLLPICLGVAVSCADNSHFHLFSFIFSMLSNLGFSSRAVLAKKLFILYPKSFDEIDLFYHISFVGLFLLVPSVVVFERNDLLHFLMNNEFVEIWNFFLILLINGLAYSIYNLVSFLVLSRTDLITHAVLNCFRRVFIIVFTSWFFSNVLNLINIIGIIIAICGVLLFSYSKHREKMNPIIK